MSTVNLYKRVLISKTGKISLLISLGGLLVTVVMAIFAVNLDRKFSRVEADLVSINSQVKSVQVLADEYFNFSSQKPAAIISNQGTKQKYPNASLLSPLDSAIFKTDSLLESNNRPVIINPERRIDTIRTTDTITLSLLSAALNKLGFSKTTDKNYYLKVVSDDREIRNTINLISEYNSQLVVQNQSLADKVKEYQQEIALIKGERDRTDNGYRKKAN